MYHDIAEWGRRLAASAVLVLSMYSSVVGVENRTELSNVEQRAAMTSVDDRREDEKLGELRERMARVEQTLQAEHEHIHGEPCVITGKVSGRLVEYEIRLSSDCDAQALLDCRRLVPPNFECRAPRSFKP
jgi:hypothetical protein